MIYRFAVSGAVFLNSGEVFRLVGHLKKYNYTAATDATVGHKNQLKSPTVEKQRNANLLCFRVQAKRLRGLEASFPVTCRSYFCQNCTPCLALSISTWSSKVLARCKSLLQHIDGKRRIVRCYGQSPIMTVLAGVGHQKTQGLRACTGEGGA